MTYTITIDRFEPTDARLGRHVHHDSRNRQYAYPAPDMNACQDLTLTIAGVNWQSHLPISDQGNVGACVGFTVLDILGYDPYWLDLTGNQQAYLSTQPTNAGDDFYHRATVLDSFPGTWQPDDTGSDGPSGAKGGMKAGFFSGYQHAFGPQAFDAALAKGPVMVGTRWDNSMMTPDSTGTIVPDKASGVAGGHEYLIVGYSPTIDAYKMQNHWTANWGIQGFAYIPRMPFLGLLADQGDVTIPTPLTAPAPTPTPPSPSPSPADADLKAAWTSFKRYAKKQGWK